MTFFQRIGRALALASLILGLAGAAHAQWAPSAVAPAQPKAAPEAMRLPLGSAAVSVWLGAIDPAAIATVREANTRAFQKKLQIGLGRDLDAGAKNATQSVQWTPVAGGAAAQFEVTSPGAAALRIAFPASAITPGMELRFAGRGSPDTIYGPFTSAQVDASSSTYWSPVLEGETAVVEVFVVDGAQSRQAPSIEQVSHLFVSPSQPRAETMAKAAGACEVDLICLSANDSALASMGRGVARMTFSDGTGTFLCTGTLLNPLDGSFVPYFYGANHCISTQSAASTLTTHWFYDATSCGSGVLSASYTQVTGGATLLYNSTANDGLLLRLNNRPPAAATFVGWDATTVTSGAAAKGVHHPAGDLKKVSLGTIGNFNGGINSPTSGSTFIIVNWQSVQTGVTEGGSSGSGIFTQIGSPATDYRLRGGLQGGPSSCSASGSGLQDYYSRFDLAYPSISQYLNPTTGGGTGTTANMLINGGFESAASAWTQISSGGYPIITNDSTVAHGGTYYAYLGGYDNGTDTLYQDVAIPSSASRATLQFWYRINTQETSTSTAYDTMTVTLVNPTNGARLTTLTSLSNLDKTTAWAQTNAFDVSAFKGQTVRVVFSVVTDSSNPTAFRVDDVSLSADPTDYTALWWNANESGWGINVNHQGNIVFATLFTYDSSGNAMWLVMSAGARQGATESFSGDLYRTTGPAFNANPFTPIGASNITKVGTMTLAFSGSSGTLSYTFNGIAVTKAITRQQFGSRLATCQLSDGDRSSLSNYQDLWWNPSESGWGINITQQDTTLFATLFDYDTNGQGMWLVMSAGTRQSDGSYLGNLYRTTGPAFNANPFTPIGASNITQVGTMRLTFANGTTGTLNYSVNGVTVTKTIVRQIFANPVTACAS